MSTGGGWRRLRLPGNRRRREDGEKQKAGHQGAVLRVILVERLEGSVTHETEDEEREGDRREPPRLHGSQASERPRALTI